MTTLRKVFRYRIYPSKAQTKRLLEWENALRFLWNIALEQWLMASRHWGQHTQVDPETGVWTNRWRKPELKQQRDELRELVRELPWLADLPFRVCDEVLQDLNRSWERYFKGTGGRPSFRRKSSGGPSVRANNAESVRVRRDSVTLPKIGKLRMVIHRRAEGRATSCAVVRELDQWFAAVNCELTVSDAPTLPFDPAVALDLGVAVGVADSDGRLVEMPRPRESRELELRAAARRIERHDRGSNRRARARMRLAKIQRTIKRVRRDGANGTHPLSRFYADRYATVVVERLKVRNMSRSAKGTAEEPGTNVAAKAGLNRAILDMGWSDFVTKLRYKLAWRGGRVVDVPAQYSSQTCSACGVVDAASRERRDFECTSCGHIAHADTNAAQVLLVRGKASVLAPAETPAVKRKTYSIKNKQRKRSVNTEASVA